MKRFLDHIEESIIGIVLFVMLAIVFFNALSRYLINFNMASSMEIVTSLFPWLTFLGAAVVVKKKGHIGFSLLTDLFPARIRRVVPIFASCCIIFVFSMFTYLGMEMVLFERETHQVTPALELPTWVIELSIPLGSLAVIIRTVQTHFRFRAKHRTAGDEDLKAEI